MSTQDREQEILQRLKQAKQFGDVFPKEAWIFREFALNHPHVVLADVAHTRREIGDLVEHEADDVLWKIYDPDNMRNNPKRTLPREPKTMTHEEYMDHLFVLHAVYGDMVDLRKITPWNVIAVRTFIAKTKSAPRAVIIDVLANPDTLLALDMGAVDLPAFADVLPHLPEEVRERFNTCARAGSAADA